MKNISNKMVAVVLLLVFGCIWVAPVRILGQTTQKRVVKTAKPEASGTLTTPGPCDAEYYTNDEIWRTSKDVRALTKENAYVLVGGNPQCPNLPNFGAGFYEEALTKPILVQTMDKNRVLWQGMLPTHINGQPVIVIRQATDGKLVAIKNCGNWAREMNAVPKPPPPIDNTCKPGTPREVGRRTEGDTLIITYDDGCNRFENRQTTKVVKEVEKVTAECKCPEDALKRTPLLETGGGIKIDTSKKYKVRDVIAQRNLPAALADAITKEVASEYVKYLLVLESYCEGGPLFIRYIDSKGRSGKFWWILGGIVAAVIGGIVIYSLTRGGDKVIPTKTVNLPPTRTNF